MLRWSIILVYAPYDREGYNSGNTRNGVTTKTLNCHGEIEIETPLDRNGTFNPQIVCKSQTRITGMDDQIISLYARGMSTRDIR